MPGHNRAHSGIGLRKSPLRADPRLLSQVAATAAAVTTGSYALEGSSSVSVVHFVAAPEVPVPNQTTSSRHDPILLNTPIKYEWLRYSEYAKAVTECLSRFMSHQQDLVTAVTERYATFKSHQVSSGKLTVGRGIGPYAAPPWGLRLMRGSGRPGHGVETPSGASTSPDGTRIENRLVPGVAADLMGDKQEDSACVTLRDNYGVGVDTVHSGGQPRSKSPPNLKPTK
ncbi:hypothetical protein AURDEDRAFT_128767 [Auricularia subglabra TFB-10046 SS5]|nr:hypothetical protein AURDEDRAFT_128767 [Auricularia subglabra TFB-10046 SS5]